MENFPKRYSDIQQPNAGYGAAHPSGSNDSFQRVHSCFARGVEQKIVIAPIAQTKRSLRHPRQKREHDAYFQAQDDVENDA